MTKQNDINLIEYYNKAVSGMLVCVRHSPGSACPQIGGKASKMPAEGPKFKAKSRHDKELRL